MTQIADVMVRCPKTHGRGVLVAEILDLFQNDHVHMALVAGLDGRLVTCIERADIEASVRTSAPASTLGTLVGRTAGPAGQVSSVRRAMAAEGRRRLAIVDGYGRLLGLLCLKRDGSGFCSDEGIRDRAAERDGAAMVLNADV